MKISETNTVKTNYIFSDKEINDKKQKKSQQQIENKGIEFSISEKGMEQYRKSIQNNSGDIKKDITGKSTLTKILQSVKYDNKLSAKVSWTKENSISDIAEKYVKAYSDLYDEISKGYANGTREIYVLDESSQTGYRKLTMEEELQALSNDYEKASEMVEKLAENSKKAAEAFEKYSKKLAKITGAGEKAAIARKNGNIKKEKVPEKVGEKMNQLALKWKDSYLKTSSKNDSWESILPILKSTLYVK